MAVKTAKGAAIVARQMVKVQSRMVGENTYYLVQLPATIAGKFGERRLNGATVPVTLFDNGRMVVEFNK